MMRSFLLGGLILLLEAGINDSFKPPVKISQPRCVLLEKPSSTAFETTQWKFAQKYSIREKNLRLAIQNYNWTAITEITNTFQVEYMESNHRLVFVITETCRRTNKNGDILKILKLLPSQILASSSEDDIIPWLSNAQNPIDVDCAYSVIQYLCTKGFRCSARTFSILVSKFGKLQNENSVDKILQYCYSENIKPDTIFLNSAIDAYVR